MFAGTSYYHQPQTVGRRFAPGKLLGYFNDLTGKTNWNGKTDANGLPLSTLSNRRLIHFPILLCQKALGHWDLWLMQPAEEHRQSFLAIAAWLLETQDVNGGWDTWGPLGQPDQYQYSAMTQGEALSVLVRAHGLTLDPRYDRACARAVALMQIPVEQGGVCVYEGDDVFLEEFPARERDTVLNGWIFALFGIYDYLLQFTDERVDCFYTRGRASLVRRLPEFDAGYWSYYSSGSRRLASPFYHRLHISQLEVLKLISEESRLAEIQKRWAAYEQSAVRKAWAVTRKGVQKLREPREITIVG